MEIHFDYLDKSDLIINCVYKGGNKGNIGDEPFHKLIPGCENSGGFRKKLREDNSGKYAYVVLYTSMEELEWPDFLEDETGIFRYYGDNRKPGCEITNTHKKGNKILEMVFNLLNEGTHLEDIPPFLVFKKTGSGRDIKFLGLAAPGNPSILPDRDLVAFWRTVKENRFQNYEAYFTILDTGEKPISRKWIESLIYDHDNSMEYAPDAWKEFIQKGRNGIKALKTSDTVKVPSVYNQLEADEEGNKCLRYIRRYYHNYPQGFEECAIDIMSKIDSHFRNFSMARPWRDGGVDATGQYVISTGGKFNCPLKLECALEAKCYSEDDSVGDEEISRLLARIQYRKFGVLITTSYVNTQVYQEVIDKGHPILLVTASDIASVLRKNAIDSSNVDLWLDSCSNTLEMRKKIYSYR